MPAEPTSRLHPHALAAIALVLVLLVTWFAYTPALSGIAHFDDRANLSGLATVHDKASAFRFVATGTAGPTGRPLSLASFVPQAYAWPESPDVFLRTNILIHLLNGTLITWFLYLLGTARRQNTKKAALIAIGSGAIWMLMPLLASSSLFIVQRMTTLSAVFTVLGAVAYMYARRSAERHPASSLVWMILALVAGVTLGALAKENGVLLFLFILSVEATLLARPPNVSRRLWRIWVGTVLVIPLLAILVYLGSALPYPESLIVRRDFTGFERLITQAEILWKYLYLAFIPNIAALGPFHDDYAVSRSLLELSPLLSVGTWVTAITGAILLRRKAPLFSFAVAWYLSGHLLESTVLSLELYFEHRNYMPLVGPTYALVASLGQVARKWRRVSAVALAAYILTLASVLFSTASLWGAREVAAEMWQLYRPQSLRATQNLAGELERNGYFSASRRLLNGYVEANPNAHGVRLQVLALSCHLEPMSDHSDEIRALEETLPIALFDYSFLAAFQQLYNVTRDDRCRSVRGNELYHLGRALLSNPRFNLPRVRHSIHVVMARVAIDQNDLSLAMAHINEAQSQSYNFDTLVLAIGILNSAGRHDLSWELLNEARAKARPNHPLQAIQWNRDVDRIEAALTTFEQQLGESTE